MKGKPERRFFSGRFALYAAGAVLLFWAVIIPSACEVSSYPYFISTPDTGAALDGLRWEIPCDDESITSTGSDPEPVTAVFNADGRDNFNVTLRFRGVVEQKTYVDGSNDGAYWQEGGTPQNDPYNIYRLEISDPSAVYYVNRGESYQNRCWGIDFEKSIPITSGATVTLTAETIDGELHGNYDENGDPIPVPGVEPYPETFIGQFVQMDVVDITPSE